MRGLVREGKGRWFDFEINNFNIFILSFDIIFRDKGKLYIF